MPKGLGFDGPHNMRYSPDGYYHRLPMDEFVEARPGDAAVVFGIDTGNLYTADFQYDHRGFRNSPSEARPDVMLVEIHISKVSRFPRTRWWRGASMT